MINKEVVIKRIISDWKHDSEAIKFLTNLTEYLFRNKNQQLHLTYRSIANITGSNSFKKNTELTNYLTGIRVPLLKLKLEYINGNNVWDIEDEDLYLAITLGEVVHPESGELIQDAANHLFPYFVLSGEIK